MPDRHPVDELLGRSAGVEIPPEVETRMRQQLAAFRARLDREQPPFRERAALLVARPPFRWAAAAVVLATVFAIVFVWGGTDGSRVYAEAAARLAAASSVQYTMELAPFVTVEFSHLEPAHERISTSWGIEIRTDGSDTQLVLLHASRQYVREPGGPGNLMRTADLVDQLAALPRRADAALGERAIEGRRCFGYRVLGTRLPGGHGVESLELWIDAESGALDHVDVTPAGAGASGYRMHISGIRVGADVDPALFDMTPPPGYSDAKSAASSERSAVGSPADRAPLQPQITQATPQSAIVIPMRGAYRQAGAAVERVSQYLRQNGIVPAGPAFGRFASESQWEAGYPVPAGTTVRAPFQVIELPGGLMASLTVTGPWGDQSAGRWYRLFAWLGEQGYRAIGPPMEVWSGDEKRPDAQVTEMHIAVARATGR